MSTPHDFVKPQQFSKRNYGDTLGILTPKFYFTEDINLSGVGIDLLDKIINSHIIAADNIDSIIPITSTSSYDITGVDGLAPYFIKQNNLTNITPFTFEQDILHPLGYTYSNFATKADFIQFLKDELLPLIELNNPTTGVFGATTDECHDYLISKLSWFYILNNSIGTVTPNNLVASSLGDLYSGKNLTITDGVKAFSEFIWRNKDTFESIDDRIYPNEYVSGVGYWTSGDQQLNKLLTLVDIIYATDNFNAKDFHVKEAFDDYISVGSLLDTEVSKGPFYRFLQAIGFSIADRTAEADSLFDLFDIEKCPAKYLVYLANLIGWKLIGYDSAKWRLQLRRAIEVYRSKGTKRSIKLISDLIFSEDTFDITTRNLFGLYESYIPNLLYYVLATDSMAFASGLTSWTQEKATALGIPEYSFTDVDTNIRLVIDHILLDIHRQFPGLLIYGDDPFPIEGTNPNFVFFYRGRDFPIPPWEEEKFYQHSVITKQVLDYLYDILACYGVSQGIRQELVEFIVTYVVAPTEDVYLNNKFLFFTTSAITPPNFSELLFLPTDKKTEFFPYWNSKSSHFSLIFDVSSFDFDKTKTLSPDSAFAVDEIVRGIDQVIPAHAIPNVQLNVSNSGDVGNSQTIQCMKINLPMDGLYENCCIPFLNTELSSVEMSSYGHSFKRSQVDDFFDVIMSASGANILYRRNSLRRRNLKKLLPGFYNYSGFDDPPYVILSSINYLNWHKLGLIPSSGEYETIPDINNLPPVYEQCQGLFSSSVFYDVPVSNTFPSRGLKTAVTVCPAQFRSILDTPEIITLISKIYERYAYYAASALYEANLSSYITSSWIDHVQSSANILVMQLSSFDIYENFAFGQPIHYIYGNYNQVKDNHLLGYNLLSANTIPNIFGHTYGPLLLNNDFDIFGSALNTYPELYSSGTDFSVLLNGRNIFSGANISGTELATGASSIYIIRPEFRNAHLISGIELICPSSVEDQNGFSIIQLNSDLVRRNSDNYTIDNTLIKMKGFNNLHPRIKFDLKNYFTSANHFTRDHDYEFKVRCLGISDDNKLLGGVKLGIWIHTKEEGGNTWCWTTKKQWEQVPVSDFESSTLGLQTLYNNSFIFNLPPTPANPNNNGTIIEGKCIDEFIPGDTNIIRFLKRGAFSEFTVKFNTKNLPIALPDTYIKFNGQVHRTNQNYHIELFMIPQLGSNDKSLLIEEVFLQDLTLFSKTYIPVSGYNIPVSNEELLTILQYFKELSQEEASRTIAVNSTIFNASGGSRLNYRMHPYWSLGAPLTSNMQISSLSVVN